MKKIYLLLVLFSLIARFTIAQETTKLEIGQKMPDIKSLELFKEKGNFNFTRYKGKLIILDFFSIHCVPCIKAVPEMDALQKEFGDKIQVVIVSIDTRNNFIKFAKTSGILAKTTLPIITNGLILKNGILPFSTVPTHVWIDQKGIFRFISDGENTTKENLTKFLKNEEIKLESVQSSLSANRPLWNQFGALKSSDILNISLVTKMLNGISTGTTFLRDSLTGKSIGIRVTNAVPTDILTTLYRHDNPELNDDKRIIYDLGDSTKYFRPGKRSLEWEKAHLFCYELNVPINEADSILSFVKYDMKRIFQVDVKLENRKTKCLVLSILAPGKLKTAGEKRLFAYDREKGIDYKITNAPFDYFYGVTLGSQKVHYPYPVLNETGFHFNVDLKIDGSLDNLESVKTQLLAYGLELSVKERTIKMLVISDTK